MNLLSFLNREMKCGGTLRGRKQSILDVLGDSASRLDVEVLKHPMEPHMSYGLFRGRKFGKTGGAVEVVSPRADVFLSELLSVDKSEPVNLFVTTDGLGQSDLRHVLGFDELGVCCSMFFGKLKLLSLLSDVEMGFKGERLGVYDLDVDARFFLPGHEGSLTYVL